jgi:hypothetical protein
MTSLVDTLNEIYSLLELDFPDALTELKPPLSKKQVKTLLPEFLLLPNDDLCELYSWRNGLYSENSYNRLLFQGYNFNSLQDTLNRYEILMSIENETSSASNFNKFWDRQWLPILNTDRSDIFVITSSDDTSLYDKFFQSEPRKKFNSLTSMALTTLECLENKVYQYDEDDVLEVDLEAQEMIRRKHNPGTYDFSFD